jgi:periplasmic divalent cation tolerance protein
VILFSMTRRKSFYACRVRLCCPKNVCAKRIPIESAFWWEGKKDSVDEILVMFETAEEKFDELEKVVDELHSYEAPMLFSIQVHRTTDKVSKWLKEELS